MKQLNLHKDVKYWVNEAIDFSSLSLNHLYGWVDFNDVNNAYKNLYAHAIGHNLKYAYNKNLDSIHTKTTELEFKNGVLYIYPKQATTYQSNLGKSWIKIDFTQDEELLTFILLFDGKLDPDTLGILEEFKIKIPFLQNTGKTKVNLNLSVNLRTIAINAKGVFFTKKANFKYHGYDIDIFNAKIELDNYDVRIKKMQAKYKDIISTEIDVLYNAQKNEGILDFRLSKIDIDKSTLKLHPQKKYLKATYKINPTKDFLTINKSYWQFKEHNIELGKISLPLDLEKLELEIQKTKIYSKTLLNADISGKIDLKKLKAELDLNLKNVYFGGIELSKKKNAIKIKYDKSLNIQTKNILEFTLNSEKSFLNPTSIELKNNHLILSET
ncbi:MAG: hypothetical protein JKY28_03085, partial [Sulfurimonas sp.]|nr:hypothetical protein [Sulfurimonas sp.]